MTFQAEVEGTRESAWAKPVQKLTLSGAPDSAINLNVNGRQITGPLRGFGQMWQKIYRVRLTGASPSPAEVIEVWKNEFPSFWPRGNRFYGSVASISPGEVALINLAGPGGITAPGGAPLISTGILVLYADDTSFSFLTPEGHPVAGMNTFSAFQDQGTTVAQVECIVRASDPIYEIAARLGILYKMEDEFWSYTVQAVATRFHVNALVEQNFTLIDPQVQWKYAGQILKNAAIWSGLYLVASPLRWGRNRFGGKGSKA